MKIIREPFQVLSQKLHALEQDVTELSKMTSSAAGEKIEAVTTGLKEQYGESSKAAKEYVVDNPARATLIAGAAGFAIGYLVRLIWRKP